ncbi:MAG: sugar phosphate isomerase/epimerase, partial [Hungatella hathewayi]|nr:sugar phosphate isomerase/epimerase [Hungatella hathewayi]
VQKAMEAYGDQHPRFGFPGSANDTAELLDFFRILKAEGFFYCRRPYTLSLEVKPWKNEDGDIILANTKRVINRAWALLEE